MVRLRRLIHRAGLTRRGLLADAGLALLAFALLTGILASGGLDEQATAGRGLDPLGVGLLAVATLPLAARRIVPLTVFGVVVPATLALWVLDYRSDIPLGLLIGTYTLASVYGGASWRWRGPALAMALSTIPAAAVVYGLQESSLSEILVPELALWSITIASVWVFGELTRLRRERIAELADRARRTAREAERERRITAAEERIRIARELHDSAGHAINVILVQAGAARLLHERDPATALRAVTTIEEVARDTIGEIDRLVRVLRADAGQEPAPADPAAIEELVERYRAGGLEVTTKVRGARRTLPRSVAWAAYRILQEALTNAARHGTGRASVTVQFGAAGVDLTVTNPAGGDCPAPAGGVEGTGAGNGGHGIVGMRERATLLGGTLETGRDGEQFRLRAWLPHTEPATR